jgi:trigger factor
MVEKVVDQQLLQNKVIDHVVNDLYTAGLEQEKLRPVAQPEVSLTKFVPFTTLEMNATVEVVGEVKLPDYKKFKVEKKVAAVTDAEIEAVVDDLLARSATKNEVKRAAADGDEATIDFAGVDAKSQEEIEGAKGEDYPLVLGSNTFIPGFEPELLGLKAGEGKTFDVTFPKDYGAVQLQNKKVTFTVTVKLVKERVLPKLDAAFAASVGPFKSVAELRTDIRKQMGTEKEREAQAKLESDVLEQLGQKAQIAMPDSLVEQEIDRMDEEEKRNLMYRGQTWQEHLKAEGKTEEEHRESHREQAALRVKTGIALGEVAEKESVRVSQEEFDARLSELKKQYTDQQMLTELEKPENQRDILSRMLTEKTIAVLVGHAGK